MNKVTSRARAARKAERITKNSSITITKEDEVHHTIEQTFSQEVVKPIVRMLGHTLSSAAAYGIWCLGEILIAKVLALVFELGTRHQIELFEAGESLLFYSGFLIWTITFFVGAARLVMAETKIFGKI
ncbi:hypothetical protein LPN04_29490 [Rugamonas sp. A1-17]|nr:hypothetical protein [Rugamonas sp. A1-17]